MSDTEPKTEAPNSGSEGERSLPKLSPLTLPYRRELLAVTGPSTGFKSMLTNIYAAQGQVSLLRLNLETVEATRLLLALEKGLKTLASMVPSIRNTLDPVADQYAAFKALGHDLNNMLTAISGSAELLPDVESEERRINHIERIESTLQRMALAIITTIGKEKVEAQMIKGVRSSLEGMKTGLPEDFKISLDVQIDPDSEAQLNMVQSHFVRLLFNLADNAYKAGARSLHVTVFLEGGYLVLRMKDNGPGFSGKKPLEASRLSRVRNSRNGNGIPICLDFCTKAGGSLVLVDENDSTGAEWLISLPIREADPR